MLFVQLNYPLIFKRVAKALIRLRVCVSSDLTIEIFRFGPSVQRSSLGSSLIIFSSFLFFRSLVKNDSLGNFDFDRQRHLDFSSNFEG